MRAPRCWRRSSTRSSSNRGRGSRRVYPHEGGPAQKVVLNLFSALVMIRLGRVYRGLMVNMRTRNAKLLLRATAMVSHLAHWNKESAREALVAADGDLELAVLFAQGTDAETATTLIRRNRGHLRSALAHRKASPKSIANQKIARANWGSFGPCHGLFSPLGLPARNLSVVQRPAPPFVLH